MDDVRQRLIKCFSAVFPELTKQQIEKATPDDTSTWDSLNWVTVVAVIQEEFGIQLDVESAAGGISFEDVLSQVNDAVGKSKPPGASSR